MAIKVGVIGTGNIGTEHVRRLASEVSGAVVGAVFDVDTGRARQVAESVGATAHPKATDVIHDPAIDAIVIASPGTLHAEQTIACIAAGKPVLCEKPLATTAQDCLDVIDAEVAAGRRLVQVGFMRRYDAGYRVVKAAVDDGSVGEPLLLHCVHRNESVPPTFTSDMSLTDSVIHEIDAARWLLGQEIVAATVLRTRPSPVVAGSMLDPQLVLLETETGATVTVEVFVNCRYGYDVRCEVVGSEGTASLDLPTTGALTRAGARSAAVPADWRVRFGPAYQAELQEWVNGLRDGVVVGPSAWDGYAATAVAAGCVASLSSGSRVPVELIERPALYGGTR
jgi:myo-inositol 2-dehydrogenase/D-chiro-inositol 1-dehydrogenase